MKRQSKLIVLRKEEIPGKHRYKRPTTILHCTHVNKGKKYPYWSLPRPVDRSLLSQLVGRQTWQK